MPFQHTYTGAKPFTVLQEGEVAFAVEQAQEKFSKAGKDMIECKFRLTAPNGSTGTAFYYLVADAPGTIDPFLEAIGNPATGQTITLSADSLVGRSGRCKVKIEEYNGKESNKISDFLPATGTPHPVAPAPAPTQASQADPADEIPF